MKRKVRIGALLLAIAMLPTTAPVQRASAAEAGLFKGCWFTPPAPPSCQTCADNCNPGQRCCIIIAF